MPSQLSEAPTPLPAVAIGTWAFAFGSFERSPWPIDRVADYAVENGYDALEINGFRPHPHDQDYADAARLTELTDILAARSLTVSGYAPDFRGTPPADVDAGIYMERFVSALSFCRAVGAPSIRVDTISPPAPVERGRMMRLAATWRQAARLAADQGVRLVWEFEPGFFINRPSDVVALVEGVDDPNFGVLFDTSHAYTTGVCGARQGPDPELLDSVADYARLLGESITHLHLIDSDGSLHDEETSAHLAFGDGDIDFASVIEALPDRGLALAAWTVDLCFSAEAEEQGAQAQPIVRDLIAMAAALRDSEESRP